MTQTELESMTPTALLNHWAEMHRGGRLFGPGGVILYEPRAPGYRVQRLAPDDAELPNEVKVALWVHIAVKSLDPVIYWLFEDGESVQAVETTIGERITAICFDTENWSPYKRAKFERTSRIQIMSPRQFGLDVIAKAELLIAEKMEKFPPKLNGPDPEVIKWLRKKRSDEKASARDAARYDPKRVKARPR